MILNYFYCLGDECKDEFPADLCLIIKQLGSCSQDLAKSICKKTCDNCEDDEEETTTETVVTTAPQGKNPNAYVSLQEKDLSLNQTFNLINFILYLC